MPTLATNIVAALVTITVVSNSDLSFHPSGQSGYRTNQVWEEHRIHYEVHGRPFNLTNHVGLATNATRLVLQEAPLQPPRRPLEAVDLPPLPP